MIFKNNVPKVEIRIKGDLNDAAKDLSKKVFQEISKYIDDANKNSFYSNLEIILIKLLRHTVNSKDVISIYEETIPGFTIMTVNMTKENYLPDEYHGDLTDESVDALSLVINSFINKSKQDIFFVQHSLFSLILFPVTDTKKHLKMLGFI